MYAAPLANARVVDQAAWFLSMFKNDTLLRFILLDPISWVSLAACGAGEQECAFAGVAGTYFLCEGRLVGDIYRDAL